MVLKASTLIALLLLAGPVCAQDTATGNQPGNAIPVRCVNTLGTAFEACGGGGGAGADVNITGVGGNAVTTTVPVSGTIAVTGTFWQATQPVSGAFFQATQPVSIASMPSTPVTGTFWQATQPVSGTFWQATQPVSFTQPALVAGSALIGKVGIDQTTPGTTNRVDVGVFPDNEPINVAQMNGVAVSMGVGASGTGTQRTATLIHDGTDTAQVTATSGGSLQVECAAGCGSAATSNLFSLSVPRESVAAPTAATWYLKRQWALPASAHVTPTRVYSMVTTAGSQTLIGIANKLGTLNVGTNAFTDGNSVSSPNHYSRLIGCVTTILSATPDNLTVTYTDDLGNTGHATGALTFAASSPVGNCFEFALAVTTGQMRDNGVRDVTNITDSAATTGIVDVFGVNQLLDSHGQTIVKEWSDYDGGELAANEQILILFQQAATTAQLRGAGLTGSIR